MNISILVNGVATASRKWPAVPRVGDYVELDGTGQVLVAKVVWRRVADDPLIELHCKKAKNK